MTEPCPGACNAAHRATGDGDPYPGDPVWCARDASRILHQLTQLDYAAAILASHADGHREQATDPVRGSRAAPSPSPHADVLDELRSHLLGWEDAYRDLHPAWVPAKPRHGYQAEVRTEVIAWLAERLPGILACPFAVDFGHEIGWWHNTLAALAKTGTGRHLKPVPCPWCDMRLLTWTEGDGHVACAAPACRYRAPLDEYDAMVRHAARAAS